MKLPEEFIQQMRSLLGGEAEAFFASLDTPSPVSVRINSAKSGDDETAVLPSETTGEVLWCPKGHYLSSRPSFSFDPLFHAGCYYVQEASSMFLWQAVKEVVRQLGDRPLTVLDLCAAPGGKSTLLVDALPAGSVLVVNEVVRQRANILEENMTKWGTPSVIVASADPSQIGRLKSTFDFILTDVPCSGEGMFRKEEDALSGWGPGNVDMCADRQRTILEQIWPALKPGGCLVYSTCTYNRQEDEENVAWICSELGAESLRVTGALSPRITGTDSLRMTETESPQVTGTEPLHSFGIAYGIHPAIGWDDGFAYRFFPHLVAGEGLFMSLVRKEGTDSCLETMPDSRHQRKSQNKNQASVKVPECVQAAVRHLVNPDEYEAKEQGGGWIALPLSLAPLCEAFTKNKIYMLSAGIRLGEVKGKDFLPDTALALSTALDRGSVLSCELTLEQAIAYLSKEALVLPPDVAKGFVLVCCKGWPLGWVKNLGNRANNLYPSEWRIRTQRK